MKRTPRDEIDGPTQRHLQLLAQLLDLPTELTIGRELVQQVDVTVRIGVAGRKRTKHVEADDPEPCADLRDSIDVNHKPVKLHEDSVDGESRAQSAALR